MVFAIVYYSCLFGVLLISLGETVLIGFIVISWLLGCAVRISYWSCSLVWFLIA